MKNIFLLYIICFGTFLNAQNYIPDSSFGNNGSVVTNYNMYYDNNQAPKSVHYVNNKYIFGQKTQLSCFTYNGAVDFSFGTSGYSRLVSPTLVFEIKKTKIINDNIYIIGTAIDNTYSFKYGFIAKMDSNGALDATFGTNGILTINIGNNDQSTVYSGFTDIVYKDNYFFALGTTPLYTRNIIVSKISTNGVIDYSFDPSGFKRFPFVNRENAENIFEYEDDLLILANLSNSCNSGTYPDCENSILFLKINENGNYVTNFGANGVKKIVLIPGGCYCGESIKDCTLIGDMVYLIKDHGEHNASWRKIQRVDLTNLSVTDIDGIYHSGSSGKYLIDNDKIYILDCLDNSCQPNFNITKRNLDGTLDTTFNQTGMYSYDFPTFGGTTFDSASVLVKHSDNRLFIGGYTGINGYTTAPQTGFAMARIVDQTLSNNEFEIQDNFKLFPNPVQNILTIQNLKNTPVEKIFISDISGKIVYYTDESMNNINLENLNNGMYFVKIYSANNTETFKIIKDN